MKRRQLGGALLTLALPASLSLACDKKSEKLPSLAQLGHFSLKDQEGRAVTEKELRGKVWIATFLFTRCPSTCPRIMRYLRKIQDGAKERSIDVHIVAFSVDPENDTPDVLKAYGKRFDVDFKNWSFLTGDYEVIKNTSIEGFKLALSGKANAEEDGFGILHGSHLVLVDPQLTIRGYYATDDENTMGRLLKDAKALK